ncbi:hypothetical protein PR003_g30701 [Phytophthora rubi]|uniref:Uncharacterized protein n=1 Tax=Phytophthora rubi TaxID=129364 RepID=A0A6A3H166_9STRA|nr:hypothetical protein PR002_g29532 [Phytophthora rubi]KAE8963070.1 hypothetical protein PR001_g29495 [Phytophthora rubi]KAE9270832.1 hypothetical protein PR003_g30701 [Phytophthora rubi]
MWLSHGVKHCTCWRSWNGVGALGVAASRPCYCAQPPSVNSSNGTPKTLAGIPFDFG